MNPYGLSPTKRLVVPAAEKLLYVPQQTHGEGQITLVDYMGGDADVERVATAGHMINVFPEQPNPSDLFAHLVAMGIREPFKSTQLKFHIQSCIADALHIVYAKPASVNEYSGRYSKLVDASFLPDKEYLLKHMKQEMSEEEALQAAAAIAQVRAQSYEDYSSLVGEDIDLARELARTPLELNNHTSLFWKIELDDLTHFVQRKRAVLGEHHSLYPYLLAMVNAARTIAPNATEALMTHGKKMYLTMPKDEDIIDSTPLSAPWSPAETRRVTVPELEELLFVPQEYLDHGKVQAVSYMGNNRAPVESARISYGSGTKRLREDTHLIRYLFSHEHTTPFEHAELAVEGKSPLFVDPRQAGRHRTLDFHCFMGEVLVGSNYFMPPASELRYQDRKNRQGRGKELDDELKLNVLEKLKTSYQRQVELVGLLRDKGVDENTIRRVKGVGFYTFIWRTGDIHNWNHFLRLRLDKHAQKEIRDYAGICARFVERQAPDALRALHDFQLNALHLSALEVPVLAALLRDDANITDVALYRLFGMTRTTAKDGETEEVMTREGQELQEKLQRLYERKKMDEMKAEVHCEHPAGAAK